LLCYLYILNAVRGVRSSVTLGVASSVANDVINENDVIMRTGATSAVSARCHNENDVILITAGLWRYGDWRHVATGCTALVIRCDPVVKLWGTRGNGVPLPF